MNLIEALLNRNQRGPLFLMNEELIDLDHVIQMRTLYGGLLAAVAGKSVALCFHSVFSLAKWIIFLDGVCPKILLMPREASADVMHSTLARSGVKIVVSDYLTQDNCPLPLLPLTATDGDLPPCVFETIWLLPTSGTTGTPKLIPHTISSLSQTVRLDQGKGASLRWGTLYDIGRFAGLQVFLQALLGGSSLVLLDNADLPLAELIYSLSKAGVNALSATPTMWQKILMTNGSECLNLKQITLGGEIVRQRVLDAISARYPDARITHIYASTEFGVGFSVTDRVEGFPAKWLQREKPVCRIDPESGELLLRKGDEWFATGDAVEECGDRILFLGRLNGSINVGGNKVMPEEVERILLQYSGVQMASVSAQKSSFMGNLVQAEIVAKFSGSPEAFRQGLISYCRQHIEPYKIPVLIKFVDEVSTSSTGKISRNGGSA